MRLESNSMMPRAAMDLPLLGSVVAMYKLLGISKISSF
jgi:hypothetical protein